MIGVSWYGFIRYWITTALHINFYLYVQLAVTWLYGAKYDLAVLTLSLFISTNIKTD